MWWHFWAIISSILVLSIALLWGVVSCAMRCFYPQGTRGPKVRTFNKGTVQDMSSRPGSNADPYIMNNGELAWGGGKQAPPREVYNA